MSVPPDGDQVLTRTRAVRAVPAVVVVVSAAACPVLPALRVEARVGEAYGSPSPSGGRSAGMVGLLPVLTVLARSQLVGSTGIRPGVHRLSDVLCGRVLGAAWSSSIALVRAALADGRTCSRATA